MLDALVSGGVALFVSQMLLPPSPVSLLKDAGREALGSIAEGLCVSARALSDGDATAAETSLECLCEEGWGSMASLVAARKTSGKVACRTLRGRREAGRFERLETRLGEIHLLFEGGLLLTRASRRLLDGHVAAPRWLVPTIHELVLEVMALAGGL